MYVFISNSIEIYIYIIFILKRALSVLNIKGYVKCLICTLHNI